MVCSLRSFCDAYVSFLTSIRFVVLVAWVALGAGLAIFVMKFINATTQDFSPPPGTPAAAAESQMALAFPKVHESTNFNVVLRSDKEGELLHSPSVVNFTFVLGTMLLSEFGTDLLQYNNYFELIQLEPPPLVIARSFLNILNTSLVLPVVIRVDFATKEAQTFGKRLQDVLGRALPLLNSSHTNVTAYANGIPIMIASVTKNVERDMGMMDGIVIPIAILIMAFTVRSLRMMILPIACVGLTLVTSFALMYFVTFVMSVSVTTPSLMMSISIALSVDYSLFISSRYVEELRGGMSGPWVVATVVRTAGSTIVISGVSLMVSLLALVFFPLDMLRTFGVGCSISVFMAMLVALTFSPAILLCFPLFFERAAVPTELPLCIPWRLRRFLGDENATPPVDAGDEQKVRSPSPRDEASRYAALDPTEAAERQILIRSSSVRVNGSPPVAQYRGSSMSLLSNASSPERRAFEHIADPHASLVANVGQYIQRQRSIFFRLKPILYFPWNVVVFLVVAGLAAGVGSQAARFQTTDDFLAYLSRGSQEMANYKTFTDDFGFSFTEPYYFLFRNTNASSELTLLDEDVFSFCQGFLRRVTSDETLPVATDVGAFLGIFAMDGQWLSLTNITECVHGSEWCDPNLRLFLMSTVTPKHRSFYTIARVPIAPTGNLGDPYYRRLLHLAREYKQELSHPNGNSNTKALAAVARDFDIFLCGIGPDAMDAIDDIYKLFPVIVAVSAGAVMLIVGLAFRSVVVPIRSLISIAMTEGLVFGLVVLVYQSPGILDWLGWPAVASQGAVSWTAPIVAFSVVFGVALDYDCFLSLRIQEFVIDEGMSNNDAILHGLCATGKIITAAGVIMAVAFFGLLLSSTGVLNLLGFFMVCAVLFDTYLVRPLVVPTLMSMLGRWNWWPRRR